MTLSNDVQKMFDGIRSISFFLIERERDYRKVTDSPDTYVCSHVFIQADNRLLNVGGTVHDVPNIRDEAFGLEVTPGWYKFTLSAKRNITFSFDDVYHDTPDYSGLWCYKYLDDDEIKVHLEVSEEELSDPYSDHIERLVVLKALVIKSSSKTVYIGQGSMPYDLLTTTDRSKMHWDI